LRASCERGCKKQAGARGTHHKIPSTSLNPKRDRTLCEPLKRNPDRVLPIALGAVPVVIVLGLAGLIMLHLGAGPGPSSTADPLTQSSPNTSFISQSSSVPVTTSLSSLVSSTPSFGTSISSVLSDSPTTSTSVSTTTSSASSSSYSSTYSMSTSSTVGTSSSTPTTVTSISTVSTSSMSSTSSTSSSSASTSTTSGYCLPIIGCL
jgi:hypothetical protein